MNVAGGAGMSPGFFGSSGHHSASNRSSPNSKKKGKSPTAYTLFNTAINTELTE